VVTGTRQVSGLSVAALLSTRAKAFAASVLLKTSEPILTAQQDSRLARQQEQLLAQPKRLQNKWSRLMERRVDSVSFVKLLSLNSLIKRKGFNISTQGQIQVNISEGN